MMIYATTLELIFEPSLSSSQRRLMKRQGVVVWCCRMLRLANRKGSIMVVVTPFYFGRLISTSMQRVFTGQGPRLQMCVYYNAFSGRDYIYLYMPAHVMRYVLLADKTKKKIGSRSNAGTHAAIC